MDEAVEIEGYDGAVDDTPSYSPSPGRRSAPSPGRKGGKKTLSPSSGTRHSRSIGRSFGFGFSPKVLARAASSMLLLAVLGVIAVAGILYFTFTTYADDQIMQFYGSIAAAVVVVMLLAYVVVKLLGGND